MTSPSFQSGRRLLLGGLAAVVVALSLCVPQADAIPSWVTWESADIATTLPDGTPVQASLSEAELVVRDADGDVVARTEPGWRVQQAVEADVEEDGAKELIALCWRRGSYGSSRPFWVTDQDDAWTQHLFVLRPTTSGFEPVWMSSDLGMHVIDLEAPTPRRVLLASLEGEATTWEWQGWGFTLIGPEE